MALFGAVGVLEESVARAFQEGVAL